MDKEKVMPKPRGGATCEKPGQKDTAPAPPASRRRGLIMAVAAAGIGLIVLAGCSLVAGTAPEIPAQGTAPAVLSATPLPTEITTPAVTAQAPLLKDVVEGKAVVTDGTLEYQIGGQDPVSVSASQKVPVGAAVRMWSNEAIVKIALEDGPVLMLDPFTTIYLVNNKQSTGFPVMVSLERGAILVASGSLWTVSADQNFRIWANGAMVGVRYEPLQNTMAVDCFGPDGTCTFDALDDSNELVPGQRLEYKASMRGETRSASLMAWRASYGDILPTPTVTPTPTITQTPAVTPTRILTTLEATNSDTREQPPVPNNNNDPNDPDGGEGG